MKVYVIVYKNEITSGHGSADVVYRLAGPDPYAPHRPYPAFLSLEEANNFIKNLTFTSDLKAQLLEVR